MFFYLIPEFILFFSTFVLFCYVFFFNKLFTHKYFINTIIILLLFVLFFIVLQLVYFENNFFFFSLSITKFTQFIKLFIIFFCILFFIFFYNQPYNFNIYDFSLIVFLILNGMFWSISTDDLLIIFLGFELQSLGFYILAGLQRYSVKSVNSAIYYFFFGTLFSCIFFLSIAFFYFFTGSTLLYQISIVLGLIPFTVSCSVFVFIFVWLLAFVFFFKLAVIPFHFWILEVYPNLPSLILLFFYIIPKLIYFFIFVKFLYFFFPVFYLYLNYLFLFLFFTILLGSLFGLFEFNFKRFLTYSAIVNVGFFLMPLIFFDTYSLLVSIEYFISYSFASLSFLGIYILINKYGFYNSNSFKYMYDFSKLIYFHPLVAIFFVSSLFSLAGVPPFGGAVMKFYILKLFLFNHNFLFMILVFLLSILALMMYLRFVRMIVFYNFENYNPYGFSFVKTNYIAFFIIYFCFIFNLFFVFNLPLIDYLLYDLVVDFISSYSLDFTNL